MAAFSNGYEWDCWSSKWCKRCINDINNDCPIIMNALMGNQPVEWVPSIENSLYDRYLCIQFEETK
jgi:hypothetical protein